MGTAGGEPRVLLNALAPMLGVVGDIKTPQEVVRIVSMMKDTEKLMSRCIYLNILRTTCHLAVNSDEKKETLHKFLNTGGWGVLNKWLVEFIKSENHAVLLELIEVFKSLPVTVELLKQGNTGKLMKSMTKLQHPCVKKNSSEVIKKWYAMIKVKHVKKPEPKKSEKEVDVKPESTPSTADTSRTAVGEIKKVKREKNTKERFAVSNAKPVAADSSGFMAALNITAPAPKKRRVASESNSSMPLDDLLKEPVVQETEGSATTEISDITSNSSTEAATASVPSKPDTEVVIDEGSLARKKGKIKRSIRWAPDDQLVLIKFIEPRASKSLSGNNETFSQARQMELLFEKQSMAAAHAEDTTIKWKPLISIDAIPEYIPGERSKEKLVQTEREKSVLATVYLTKSSIPDTPTEPDLNSINLKPGHKPIMIPQTYQELKRASPTKTTTAPDSTYHSSSSMSKPLPTVSTAASASVDNTTFENLKTVLSSFTDKNQSVSAVAKRAKPQRSTPPQPSQSSIVHPLTLPSQTPLHHSSIPQTQVMLGNTPVHHSQVQAALRPEISSINSNFISTPPSMIPPGPPPPRPPPAALLPNTIDAPAFNGSGGTQDSASHQMYPVKGKPLSWRESKWSDHAPPGSHAYNQVEHYGGGYGGDYGEGYYQDGTADENFGQHPYTGTHQHHRGGRGGFRGRGHSERGRGHKERGRGHFENGRGRNERGRGHSGRGRGHMENGRPYERNWNQQFYQQNPQRGGRTGWVEYNR